MEPIFFSSQSDFRKWLKSNHQKEKELLVGYYKVHTGKPSMTWSESVDQALCFGWIDGIRKSVGKESYCVRFSPRRSNSMWSAANIARVKELIQKGLMEPAGLAAFETRREVPGYTDINTKPKKLDDTLEKRFKANPLAWHFFVQQPPFYKKLIIRWIMAAKREATIETRLKKAINESAKQKRIPLV